MHGLGHLPTITSYVGQQSDWPSTGQHQCTINCIMKIVQEHQLTYLLTYLFQLASIVLIPYYRWQLPRRTATWRPVRINQPRTGSCQHRPHTVPESCNGPQRTDCRPNSTAIVHSSCNSNCFTHRKRHFVVYWALTRGFGWPLSALDVWT